MLAQYFPNTELPKKANTYKPKTEIEKISGSI